MNKYISLCYHYVRPEKENDKFPRILGNRINVFREHLMMLKKMFKIISLEDAHDIAYAGYEWSGDAHGLLITFDDGLSDHYLAAQALHEMGVRGTFFIPTCILKDGEPANPTILHYELAVYGIENFIKRYEEALEDLGLRSPNSRIYYRKGESDASQTIAAIKKIFKYEHSYIHARKILLNIYERSLKKKYPNALQLMHLTQDQISEMLSMGHSIGSHSHSHPSIAAAGLNLEELKKETAVSLDILKESFELPIQTFSYPFGGEKDCLRPEELAAQVPECRLAFTVNPIVNDRCTPPLALGRYMPWSQEDASALKIALDTIVDSERQLS